MFHTLQVHVHNSSASRMINHALIKKKRHYNTCQLSYPVCVMQIGLI